MYENKQNTSYIPFFDKNRNKNDLPCVYVLLFTVSSPLEPFGSRFRPFYILGDPGADSGDDGKSKRAKKYGTKKKKERREETGTNQKPQRRRPFGTGLVRHCPQGLFSPFFTFLRSLYICPPV